MASELPPLDTHAHIAPDVTSAQVRRLGRAVIFAVTRNLSEAASAPHGTYPSLVWGIGIHPGDRNGLGRYDPARLDRLLGRFALVGEIGLDRKAGQIDRQREVLKDVLSRAAQAPVMMSIHSSGMASEVVDLLEAYRPRGPILHWFGGSEAEAARAADAGAWFSVNGAMQQETLQYLPPDRVLTETDFPFTRKLGSSRPGATEPAEAALATAWGISSKEVRERVWRNFAALVRRTDTGDRLPRRVRGTLALD